MLVKEMIIDENNIATIPSLGLTFKVNDMAKKIIELIKQDKTKEEIVEIISKEENVNWGQVYKDIEDFYIKLKVYGLL
ncbi:PqqD family protein [Caminibacter mediatlanticus TB-2]|uniref:PqqD family protein n=1 Tax=Caminibacter mediatlanticus TB-2 TaxID=391592 RepID=A0AAI9F1T7_9BACT|nr:PqqD family peptide modification chaperone [Caminibacter mediatlanticus]EDM23089.1 hypothetical protein CMTB2_00159 [Caminibacter mediatlanticus TB-2]QCT94534.1 PqqD family protein [Caminibacter mediatlanticus TB-2]